MRVRRDHGCARSHHPDRPRADAPARSDRAGRWRAGAYSRLRHRRRRWEARDVRGPGGRTVSRPARRAVCWHASSPRPCEPAGSITVALSGLLLGWGRHAFLSSALYSWTAARGRERTRTRAKRRSAPTSESAADPAGLDHAPRLRTSTRIAHRRLSGLRLKSCSQGQLNRSRYSLSRSALARWSSTDARG